jgi:two-component system phosphate regulon response regulator PhoB/two-component system alkaline phosphatase synthesis response regulator PhoP
VDKSFCFYIRVVYNIDMTDETAAQKIKILLVEDDEFMVDLLAHELGKNGFEVTLAKTGAEAVSKFKESAPDLILLDILLPDKNGFDVLREIRRLPEGVGASVVILSNLSETNYREEAERLGAIDYLVKANFSLGEIIERIKQAIIKK